MQKVILSSQMKLKMQFALVCCLIIGLFGFREHLVSASFISATPTPTPNYSYLDVFPMGLACSSAIFGDGPSWREIKIGHTTLQEFEKIYGKTVAFYDMRQMHGMDYDIYLCVHNNIITAIKVGSELPYLSDYVAIYGKPDAVTYSQPITRTVFWFKEGVAIDVYISTAVDYLYTTVNYVIYFPYQQVDGYEWRWPYLQTVHEGISDGEPSVSDEQNPFDFEAIEATITAEPSRTPTPIFTPLAASAP